MKGPHQATQEATAPQLCGPGGKVAEEKVEWGHTGGESTKAMFSDCAVTHYPLWTHRLALPQLLGRWSGPFLVQSGRSLPAPQTEGGERVGHSPSLIQVWKPRGDPLSNKGEILLSEELSVGEFCNNGHKVTRCKGSLGISLREILATLSICMTV